MIRLLIQIFPVIYLLFTQTGLVRSQANFQINGWQLHEYNIPRLEEAIKRAPSYGVNTLVFSHELFRSVEGFLNSPERQRDIRYLASLAEKQKLAHYFWVHEFDDIPAEFREPDKRVNFDHPGLFPYLRNRYEKLIKVVPGTAGFVLTFHECGNKVFKNSEVKTDKPVSERIYLISQLLYDVAKVHNKKLIVRNFLYEPKEIEYFNEAVKKLPADILLMAKTEPHEFNPFYPADPNHGAFGGKREIIEIDLGIEEALNLHASYAQVDYIQKFVKRAREKGMAGMIGRARFYWENPFEEQHEINLYAFGEFMRNPGLPADSVWFRWARKHYNPQAAPYIVSALKRTEYIHHHARYHLGAWFTKWAGEDWDWYKYYFGRPVLRSPYKWTLNPAHKELENAFYRPDRALFDKMVREKDEVIEMTNQSIKDLALARRFLNNSELAPLENGFKCLLQTCKIQKQWLRAYMGMRMYMDLPNEENLMIVEDALQKLDALNKPPTIPWAVTPYEDNSGNVDRFILEMRWRVNNRTRAMEEDKRLMQEILNEMVVN